MNRIDYVPLPGKPHFTLSDPVGMPVQWEQIEDKYRFALVSPFGRWQVSREAPVLDDEGNFMIPRFSPHVHLPCVDSHYWMLNRNWCFQRPPDRKHDPLHIIESDLVVRDAMLAEGLQISGGEPPHLGKVISRCLRPDHTEWELRERGGWRQTR